MYTWKVDDIKVIVARSQILGTCAWTFVSNSEDKNSGEDGRATLRAAIYISMSHEVLEHDTISSQHNFTRFGLALVHGWPAFFTFCKKLMYLLRNGTNVFLLRRVVM